MVAVLLFFVFALCLVCIGFLAVRWAVRAINRSIKARQDLARGVTDMVDRLGRLESKLGESQAPKR